MTPDQGGEKTEKATPKKRQDARKKGQVLKSAEVNTALLTGAMFAALFLFGGMMANGMMQLLIYSINRMGDVSGVHFSVNDISAGIVSMVLRMVIILLPLFVTAVIFGIGANILQFGFLFSGESIKPKFSKINPVQGFTRIFSMKSLMELIKSVLKISVIAVLVYNEYMANFSKFPGLLNVTVGQAVSEIVSICFALAFKAILALVAIGIVDFIFQWWQFEKNLKMSKHEVKQEYKQQEGDPLIKSKRRERQRQMSMARMMQALPKSDVVITNPTHYAVALSYDEKVAPAPIVIAKGKDLIALKIKEKAKELRIEIVENKPVAQALYLSCEIGDRIPDDMFAAVAEILAYVYKQKNQVI